MEEEGFSKTYFNPLPNEKVVKEQEQEKVKEWKEESNKKLSESGYPYQVYNSRWHNFLLSILIIAIIIGITALVYLVWSGKFQTIVDIKQPINNLFNQTIAPIINNKVDNIFNNQFDNRANITIVINKLEVNTNAT